MTDSDWSPSTHRRQLLAGLAAVSFTGAAGCTTVLGSTDHLSPETRHDDRRSTLLFDDGDDVRFAVTVDKPYSEDEVSRYYPFHILTGDMGELLLSSFRLAFNTPSNRSLHLRELSEERAGVVDFYRDDSRSQTILEIPEPGPFESHSHQFRCVLEDTQNTPQTLLIDVDATLSGDGRFEDEYIARGQLEIQLP